MKFSKQQTLATTNNPADLSLKQKLKKIVALKKTMVVKTTDVYNKGEISIS
ncbi:hypothetical protein D3C76_175550 [compost metagenome]